VPVLCALWFLREGVRERNAAFEAVRRAYTAVSTCLARPWATGPRQRRPPRRVAPAPSTSAQEFMPHLNEGALWIRATLPYSISFEESSKISPRSAASCAPPGRGHGGRLEHAQPKPDGTEPTGFFNSTTWGSSPTPSGQALPGRSSSSSRPDVTVCGSSSFSYVLLHRQTFKNGFKGGVHLCDSPGAAKDLASKMLGQVLVTHQTGPEGKEVGKVFVGEAVDIARELYFAILIDRATSAPVVIASTEGGVDIETVAEKTPGKILRLPVNPFLGIMPYQTRLIAESLGLTGPLMSQASKLFANLYRLFIERDCSMVEVNPLVVTQDGRLMALDAKFNFDDNALYRQPSIVAMRDITEEDPREVEASRHSLNYIGLDGNIACLVNGAGLAMATMDIIQHAGGSPANFLDVGGGATRNRSPRPSASSWPTRS